MSLAHGDESPKETSKEVSDEETHVPGPGYGPSTDEETNTRVDAQQPVTEEAVEERPKTADDVISELHPEGEDGWQAVQRPRSAGSYGRRLKQRRATFGKVFSYQKMNMDVDSESHTLKNNNQNSRLYVLKKRTISHGSYTDHHSMNSYQGSKFGRRTVKTLTYRVKSIPSSTETAAAVVPETGDKVRSAVEPARSSTPNDGSSLKNAIVSLGKSPSYKEVAVAPPGTITMLQVRVPQSDINGAEELRVEKHEERPNEMKGISDSTIDESPVFLKEGKIEEKNDETQAGGAVDNNPSQMVSETMGGHQSCVVDVSEVVEDNVPTDGMSYPVGSPENRPSVEDLPSSFESENFDSSLEQVEDLKDKSLVLSSGETRGLNNKKLSASAAPFNPSPVVMRAAPVAMNITIPAGPRAIQPITPWPVNMNIHPGPPSVLPTINPLCSSPHQPYPSPPPTPGMMQSMPFMYPPYSQPQAIPTYTQPLSVPGYSQAVPTSTFPVTPSAFHPNPFTWPCNVNTSTSDCVPGTVWPGSHPPEFSVLSPVDPVNDFIKDPNVKCDDSSKILPADIDSPGEAKKENNTLASKCMVSENGGAGLGLERVKENCHPNPCMVESSIIEPTQKAISNGNVESSSEKVDGEKTFSILIRGRRNRKQTLRMPISLLNRPYGSQSFKVIYNRVVRGSDLPKFTSYPANKECTASAT